MMYITDPVFGDLFNEDSLWMRPYELEIFNKKRLLSLIVYSYEDDGSDITNHQREVFIRFEKAKNEIIYDVEKEVLNYYKENFNFDATSLSDLNGMVTLKYIKVLLTDDGEDREIGFIFDAVFDPELGVGVLVTNEKVVDVGVQDIVL